MSKTLYILKCLYNDQKDNRTIPNPDWIKRGSAQGWAQCGYTSYGIFFSGWDRRCATDEYIFDLIDDMEPSFGRPGLGEKLLQKFTWWKREERLGSYLEAYVEEAKTEKGRINIGGELVFVQGQGSWEGLRQVIDGGSPFFYSSMFSNSGHFVVCVGYYLVEGKLAGFIFHDPYGDAQTHYKCGRTGVYIEYPIGFLCGTLTQFGIRGFYIKNPAPKIESQRIDV